MKQVHAALLAAYPRWEDLQRFLRYELDLQLDRIAARQDMEAVVAAVLDHVEKTGHFPDLVAKAARLNQHLPDFQAVATQFRTPEAPRQPWNIPERNEFFTGREEQLVALHAALTQDHRAAVSQRQGGSGKHAISGLGGVGKTQLAIEYAHRHREELSAGFWVRADTESALTSGFADIAALLDLPEAKAKEQPRAVEAARRWLEGHPGWLLVLDNADEPALVRAFLPQNAGGRILLTSRAPAFQVLGIRRPVSLDELPLDQAREFLLTRTGREDALPAEQAAAEELARELDGLPLALEQAAAFITAHECSFADYLASYRKRGLALVEEYGPELGDYPASVLTTWALNFAEVEKTPASAELLRVFAFLRPDDIPLEILTGGGSELGPALAEALAGAEEDPLVLDRLLRPLLRYSLVRRNRDAETVSLHRLVQAVVREGLSDAEKRSWAERVVRALDQVFPSGEYGTWEICERLTPHVQRCLAWIVKWMLIFPASSRVLNQAGYYLRQRAQYVEAEPLYRQALDIREADLGPEHPDVAGSLNNLAMLLKDKGELDAAEPLYCRALAIWELELGPDHPIVALGFNNLGLLLKEQGKLKEAESLYRRALKIREAVLGREHPDVALTLNNLAALLHARKRVSEAEPLLRRALEIWETVLGEEHPALVPGLNNLAELLRSLDRTFEAESLYRRALTIAEKVFGPEHPNVAVSLNNLGLLLLAQGKMLDAISLQRRAVSILERTLGPDNLKTQNCRDNLKFLLEELSE